MDKSTSLEIRMHRILLNSLGPIRRRRRLKSAATALLAGLVAGSLACAVLMLLRPARDRVPAALAALIRRPDPWRDRGVRQAAVMVVNGDPRGRPFRFEGLDQFGPGVLGRPETVVPGRVAGPSGGWDARRHARPRRSSHSGLLGGGRSPWPAPLWPSGWRRGPWCRRRAPRRGKAPRRSPRPWRRPIGSRPTSR